LGIIELFIVLIQNYIREINIVAKSKKEDKKQPVEQALWASA